MVEERVLYNCQRQPVIFIILIKKKDIFHLFQIEIFLFCDNLHRRQLSNQRDLEKEMRYMIGYQRTGDDRLKSTILRYRESVSEVYFSWGGLPSGRGTQEKAGGLYPYDAQGEMLCELEEYSRAGIGLNLLLNGNCYGRMSQARVFFEKIGDTIEFLGGHFPLHSVTTTSPLIAKFIRQNFSGLETRASVNMEIGTIQGMDYLSDVFDGYYVKRELNRNVRELRKVRLWCEANGKKLYGLANSGCLNFCSAHVFHDNLVAHENEIREMDNAYEFRGMCHEYLRKGEKRRHYLRDTNFIRPEDVSLYETYFDALKLATRVNRNPSMVVEAYLTGHYTGNLPDLLEPDHAEAFYPEVVENSHLPSDFGRRTLECDHDCEACHYCEEALSKARVRLGFN